MKSVSKTMDRALEGVPIPDEVYLPPAVADGKMLVKGTTHGRFLNPEDIRDRIHKECDPMGQLMAIANGMPVASIRVAPSGETVVSYETAELDLRVKILKIMVDKLLPNMTVGGNKLKEQDSGQEEDWQALTRRRSAQLLAEEPE